MFNCMNSDPGSALSDEYRAFDDGVSVFTTEGYHAIWRAVIVQALTDLSSVSSNPRDLKNKQAAKEWLEGDDEFFDTVCHLAGIEPAYLKRYATIVAKAEGNQMAQHCILLPKLRNHLNHIHV